MVRSNDGQLIVLPTWINPADALTNVTFVGNASLVTILVAVDGPSFVTVIVYVKFDVATTFVGPIFVVRIAASRSTGVVIVFVLFPGVGSFTGLTLCAVFVTLPPAGAVTVTV